MNPVGNTAVTCTGESDVERATRACSSPPFSVASRTRPSYPADARPRISGPYVLVSLTPPDASRLRTVRPSVTYAELADLGDPAVGGVGQGNALHVLAAGVELQHTVAHRHPHRTAERGDRAHGF